MIETSCDSTLIARVVRGAALALGLGLAAVPASGAGAMDADAEEILRAMSKYLGSLPAFSVSADIDNEVLNMEGQKLQLSSSASLMLERPGRLYVHRQGPLADAEILFDGKAVTLYGKRHNVYAQIESPGTIDDAIETVRAEIGLDAPGADLLYADPYPGLTTDVLSGTYMGTAYVHGVECHYLAFRAPKVDWQLWVQAGETPLPMKYVITTKWMTGAPQYAVRFRDWDTKPQISAARFDFTPAAGAKRLESIPVNEMGELAIEEAQR